jgi:hypothetical protein
MTREFFSTLLDQVRPLMGDALCVIARSVQHGESYFPGLVRCV